MERIERTARMPSADRPLASGSDDPTAGAGRNGAAS
jgi:hypothetical protein